MKKLLLRTPLLLLFAALAAAGLNACSDSDTPQEQPAPAPTPDPDDKDDATLLAYTVAEAAYWGDDFMTDGVSNLIIYLYDSPRNDEGVHEGPKDHFNIDMNLPNYAGGELLIPAGTYPIGEPEVYALNTLEPGYVDEVELDGILYYDNYGVFRELIDADQNESYEPMNAGELTVTYENGIYTLDARFESEEGKKYHVTYTGPIEVDDESLEFDDFSVKHMQARKR